MRDVNSINKHLKCSTCDQRRLPNRFARTYTQSGMILRRFTRRDQPRHLYRGIIWRYCNIEVFVRADVTLGPSRLSIHDELRHLSLRRLSNIFAILVILKTNRMEVSLLLISLACNRSIVLYLLTRIVWLLNCYSSNLKATENFHCTWGNGVSPRWNNTIFRISIKFPH